MCRDEVLQDVESFAEVSRNRRLDDLAARFRHQTAHTGKLANLLFRTTSARVSHDVNRVDISSRIISGLHTRKHFVGDALGQFRPDLDDLVVALAMRDGAVEVLLLDRHDILLSGLDEPRLFRRHNHVVDADRDTRLRGVVESQVLQAIEQLNRFGPTIVQVAVLYELRQAFLLEQAVHEGHALRTAIVQDDPADRRLHVLLGVLHRLGV